MGEACFENEVVECDDVRLRTVKERKDAFGEINANSHVLCFEVILVQIFDWTALVCCRGFVS